MAQTDLERLSRLMLDEFKRVHGRFDDHDQRFDTTEERLALPRAAIMEQVLDAVRLPSRGLERDLPASGCTVEHAVRINERKCIALHIQPFTK